SACCCHFLPAVILLSWRQIQQRNVVLLDRVIERRHVRRHDRLPLRQLLVQTAAQKFEDFVLLRGGRVVGIVERCAKAVEGFVEHVGKGEVSFRAFHVYLNQFFFDRLHFVVERV